MATPRNEDGVPRSRMVLTPPPGGAQREERWPGANEEKNTRLRVRSAKRSAGARGLQLRHSDSGYSLIDAARKPVGDRSDLTLAEVESWLERA